MLLAWIVYGGMSFLALLYIAALVYRRWYFGLDTFFPKGEMPATRHYLRSRKKKP
jgi:hypothetical protein